MYQVRSVPTHRCWLSGLTRQSTLPLWKSGHLAAISLVNDVVRLRRFAEKRHSLTTDYADKTSSSAKSDLSVCFFWANLCNHAPYFSYFLMTRAEFLPPNPNEFFRAISMVVLRATLG